MGRSVAEIAARCEALRSEHVLLFSPVSTSIRISSPWSRRSSVSRSSAN
ncbi:MAG: hypothetical protein IPK19_37845 [Chloroflexi bacterium]|nr:hypothetical protein [Chloroflexota bacterium]